MNCRRTTLRHGKDSETYMATYTQATETLTGASGQPILLAWSGNLRTNLDGCF